MNEGERRDQWAGQEISTREIGRLETAFVLSASLSKTARVILRDSVPLGGEMSSPSFQHQGGTVHGRTARMDQGVDLSPLRTRGTSLEDARWEQRLGREERQGRTQTRKVEVRLACHLD